MRLSFYSRIGLCASSTAHCGTGAIHSWGPALSALALLACASTREPPPSTAEQGGAGGHGGSRAEAGRAGDGGSGAVPSHVPAGDGDGDSDHSTGDENDACRSSPNAQAYQTCMIEASSDEDAGIDDTWPVHEADLLGTVDAIEPTAGCRGVGSFGNLGWTDYGVHFRDAGRSLSLGFTLPWKQPLFAVGDVLHVQYQRGVEPWLEGFAPDGSVTIRDAQGALLYWTAETYNGFDGLQPPSELTITNGPSACMMNGGYCGETTRTSLQVDTGNGAVEVPFAQIRDVGDFVVLHADNVLHTSPTGEACAEMHHRISVVVIRGTRAALDARE